MPKSLAIHKHAWAARLAAAVAGPSGLLSLCNVATGVVLAVSFDEGSTLPKGAAIAALVLIAAFVAGFAWSWGPAVWVLGAEIQTLDTRASGMSAVVFCNYLMSFVIGQSFLSMLCSMRWGVFVFFASWNLVMTAWVYVLLPETKGIPLEDGAYRCLFARHPLWRRVMGKQGVEVLEREAFRANAWRQARGAEGGDVRGLARYYERVGI